jgi:6-phosphogluconolactonase
VVERLRTIAREYLGNDRVSLGSTANLAASPQVTNRNGACAVKTRAFLLFAFLLLVAGASTWASQGSANDHGRRGPFPGSVYTASNETTGNAVLVFDRLADGRLVPAGRTPTGGIGTGGGLGNQGGITLTRNERWLLIVNAGSHSLSVLEVQRRGLRLTDVEATGGLQPISVTEHRGLVYVVHAGSDSIAGFRLGRDGRLRQLEGSTRALSGSGVGPAQIAFTPDGDALVVTEKNTNKIVTFEIDRDGVPAEMHVNDSSGVTPFGFAFGRRDQIFVSEAFGGAENASAMSSYEIDRDGVLSPISASVGTGQTAACWVALTPNGRLAYVTNTGSGSISGYLVDFDGTIELLDADGRTGVTGDGSTPIDVVITDSGRYLYNLNSGTHTIGAFRVQSDGSLTPLPFTGGLPVGANGLASR